MPSEHGEGVESPASEHRGDWGLLLILTAVHFINVVDFMIMLPLGPRYLREMDLGPRQFGFVLSAYAFAAAISGLAAATRVDRYDRKHALLILFAGLCAGTLLCALARNYAVLLFARCVAGAFGGVLSAVALAIIGDAFPEGRRGFATGVVMSGFSVASILGVPAGLKLATAFGTPAPFAVLSAVGVVLLIVAIRVVPPVRGHVSHVRPTNFWRTLVLPSHVRAYLLMVSLVLASFSVIATLPQYLVYTTGFPESSLDYIYLFGGAATLVTLPLFGRLSDRHGKLLVFRILALANLVPILLLTNLRPAPLLTTLAVTTLFMILTSGRMAPALALVNSSAAPAYRGSFMSVVSSVQQMAIGLAAVVSGLLVHQADKNAPLEGYATVGYLACGFTVVSVILAGQLRRAPAAPRAVDEAAPIPEPIEGTA